MKPELCVSSREEWRSWLEEKHATAQEIWLVFYRKNTGKPCINYADSVEEALCFGWIDGIKKKIDEERYAFRFTPRRSKSKWSRLNVRRARQMIDEGKMTGAGLLAFNQRSDYADQFYAQKTGEPVLPAELEDALKINAKSLINLYNLSPGYRKQYIQWLTAAKRPETRERRLQEAIRLLADNKKLGMK